MITGIAHTALIVREYEEATSFYCEKLGFIVVEDTILANGKRWIRLNDPGGNPLSQESCPSGIRKISLIVGAS